MAGFKYPIPTQQYIHGQFVNAKGRERATLRLTIDDSVVVQDLYYANAEDIEIAVESVEKAPSVASFVS